jgi:hypothetical protein
MPRERYDDWTIPRTCNTRELDPEGERPGVADCRRLGWFSVHTPGGWTSTAPETPGAIEDLNRLITEGIWDETAQRYLDSTAEPSPPPSTDDANKEN